MLEGLSFEQLAALESPVGKAPHELQQVMVSGELRCPECWRLHTNEVPFCSSLCRMRHEERIAAA